MGKHALSAPPSTHVFASFAKKVFDDSEAARMINQKARKITNIQAGDLYFKPRPDENET